MSAEKSFEKNASKQNKVKEKENNENELTERTPTGVQGFDELIENGIQKNALILLAGATGTGKSTFAMEFLVKGAELGEPGVFVSLEEGIEENKKQMKAFGWEIEKLEKEKKLLIVHPELYDFEKLIQQIENDIEHIKAKRLVIDSISIISMFFKDKFKVRKSLLTLERRLKKLQCTTMAISETREESKGLSMYGVEEFIVDGVIVLYLIKKENMYSRGILVRKMRGTNHSLKIHPIQIKRPGGIIVYPNEELFAEM